MEYDDIKKTKIPRNNVLEFYGAIYNVAEMCNLSRPYFNQKNKVIWQHGWKPSYYNINPKIVVGYNDYNPDFIQLVARKDQELYLKANGYSNVFPIGLPICYVPEIKHERLPNSLLVMPPHSLESTRHEDLHFKQYVKLIEDLKRDFSEIVVCVHPTCIKKRYWVDDFNAIGIPVIEGADSYDRNALIRLQYLFSRYEFVTTNSFGSHIAYAALFGAKVSIYGDYFERKKEQYNYAGVRFYLENPEIHDTVLDLISERTTRKMFPEFFTYPTEAVEKIDWARNEVGWPNKLSPEELKVIFNWRTTDIVKHRIISSFDSTYAKVKRAIGHHAK